MKARLSFLKEAKCEMKLAKIRECELKKDPKEVLQKEPAIVFLKKLSNQILEFCAENCDCLRTQNCRGCIIDKVYKLIFKYLSYVE